MAGATAECDGAIYGNAQSRLATEEIMTTAAINPGMYMQERRKAILCLCYDRDVLQVRQMLLEHFGYTVLPTSSAEDAKSVAGDSRPDMLLMDNTPPGIDCEQVAEQVKKACPTTLTVVLSSYFGVRPGSCGYVDRFVTKDDGPGALIAQIEELFQQRSERSDSEQASQAIA
jgi:CheY-like chemotaxis protein